MAHYKSLYEKQLEKNCELLEESNKLKKMNRMLSASMKRTVEADWKNKFYALEEESLKEIADLKQKIKGMKPASTKTNKEWETVFEATSKEIAELKEENEYHERECDRLSELECIAWIDFYGEETVEDDIKAYIFRRDIVHMKEENEELKKKLQKYRKK